MVEVAQTARRDYLRGLEKKYQQRWQNGRLFEVNPLEQSELVGLSQAEIPLEYTGIKMEVVNWSPAA